MSLLGSRVLFSFNNSVDQWHQLQITGMHNKSHSMQIGSEAHFCNRRQFWKPLEWIFRFAKLMRSIPIPWLIHNTFSSSHSSNTVLCLTICTSDVGFWSRICNPRIFLGGFAVLWQYKNIFSCNNPKCWGNQPNQSLCREFSFVGAIFSVLLTEECAVSKLCVTDQVKS